MTSESNAPPKNKESGETGKVGKTGKLRQDAACSGIAPPETDTSGFQFSQFSRFHTPHQKRLERIRQRLPATWTLGAELEQPDPPPREQDEDDEHDDAEVVQTDLEDQR